MKVIPGMGENMRKLNGLGIVSRELPSEDTPRFLETSSLGQDKHHRQPSPPRTRTLRDFQLYLGKIFSAFEGAVEGVLKLSTENES